ncbi:kinase-like domain-containing protein, partial [Parasitella parasitica]
LDLVRSEVAIFKKLNHRNVIKLYEVFDDPEEDSLYLIEQANILTFLFVIMEMAHKRCHNVFCINKSITSYREFTSRNYFRQMILGTKYGMANYISFTSNIKPDNILLCDNNILKIVDFGVSEMFIKEDDALKSGAGCSVFMPPELCSAERDGPISGRAADIWPLDVILYFLFHARVPF